ncbi:T9SS type A sorting domain-containing protein [Candidatus Cloacimonas acidaminovorans]|nr:T9SS type A sorting domain-containing protein [Candidatus Cloacimonas acidaminovorans]
MKYIYLIFALLACSILFAQPTYMPVTTIAEDFGATWCLNCPLAWQGLQAVHSVTHNGEFISARLFTESGSLSNYMVDERFDYYNIIGLPNVIFNGKISLEGIGAGTADGTDYLNALSVYRYSASPVKIVPTNFSFERGLISGSVIMISPDVTISDARLVYYLLEDNVGEEDHIVRAVLYDENVSLSGIGDTYNFNQTFNLNPSWVVSNLWGIVFLQLPNKTILQCISSLPLPEYNFRAAMDWSRYITGDANTNYLSAPLWFFNLGAAENYTMHLEADNAPADWYFNYCDETGNCYPGSIDRPFSMSAGEALSFHLNLTVGSSAIVDFRFVVSSPHIGSYSIPFRYDAGTPVIDETNNPSALMINNLYPNPVSGTAVFRLLSPKNNDSATIEIYNVKGQKVQCLTAINLHNGINEISFVPDSSLPNGVYFYRLQNTSSKAGRFLLLQ